MVSAIILAGGTGTRMNNKTKPKQFLTLHGKSILIHTIEHFEEHPEVEQIVVVCLGGWEGTVDSTRRNYCSGIYI